MGVLKTLALGVLVLCVFAGLLRILSPGTTQPIEGGVSNAFSIKLGGVSQFVVIRGNNANNPILFVLHGGPGDPIAPMLSYYNADLEGNFVVVNWDQRGAGRSFNPEIDPASMTAEQIIRDAVELLAEIRTRFPGQPVFMLGHSWGSYLGLRIAHKHPELICAFIGVGQVADQPASELASYQWTLAQAKKQTNSNAIASLEGIGAPIAGHYKGGINALMQQRKWVREFGGAAYRQDNFDVLWLFARSILAYREYRAIDKLRFVTAESFSMALLEEPMLNYDLVGTVDKLFVPFVILQGKHDYQTVSSVTRTFFDRLQAPNKKYVQFDNAAHLLPFEQPALFNSTLIAETSRLMATEPACARVN